MRIRNTLSFAIPFLALLPVALLLEGCHPRPTSNTAVGEDLDGGDATLDVRGAVVDSEVYLGQRAPLEGNSGDGGRIRIVASGGAVVVDSASPLPGDPLFVLPPAPPVGGGTVPSGETVRVQGAFVLTDLWVQPSGVLVITDNTFLEVAGTVLIEGEIRGVGGTGAARRDGHDLTILALGPVAITGEIDCSGANAREEPVGHVPGTDPEEITMGGHGGRVFIFSEDRMVITGQIKAEGGGNDSLDFARGASGIGGEIMLGTSLGFSSTGRLSARAGSSYTNNLGTGPQGGVIEITALQTVTLLEVEAINLAGGKASGLRGGNGGTLSIESPVGPISMTNLPVNVSGGRVTFQNGTGGNGGEIGLSGSTVTLAGVDIQAQAGSSVDEAEGNGGDGGEVNILGGTAIDVDVGVEILLNGGDTLSALEVGGSGGHFRAATLSATNTITFEGTVNVRGGNDKGGREGPPGTVCASFPADALSEANLVGINTFPVPACGDLSEFLAVSHDLDCDDSTLVPDSISTVLPTGTGDDFYRFFVPAGATEVTISTQGEAGGNIDLFVGDAAALGSLNTADYAASSQTAGTSTEEVTISSEPTFPDPDLDVLASGGFLSILVSEQGAFVENYTITVTCTP